MPSNNRRLPLIDEFRHGYAVGASDAATADDDAKDITTEAWYLLISSCHVIALHMLTGAGFLKAPSHQHMAAGVQEIARALGYILNIRPRA